MQLFINLD